MTLSIKTQCVNGLQFKTSIARKKRPRGHMLVKAKRKPQLSLQRQNKKEKRQYAEQSLQNQRIK